MKVLISDDLSEKGIDILKKSPGIKVDVNAKITPEELLKCIGEYDGLLVRSRTKVTGDVIEAAKKLKLIGRAGTGVDNVDVASATKKGIIVMNTPGGNTISAAEHTIAMLLSLARNIPRANVSVKNRQWEKKKFTGNEVFGKTLGVIGLGRIGMEVAKRAHAFGMKILAYDPYISKDHAAKYAIELDTLDGVFKKSDYITTHTPLSNDTKYLVSKSSIAKMKDGVSIINCARGGIVKEDDLAEAIKSGKVAGAALDVFEKEPPAESPLFALEEVVLTPHLGASTEEAQINVSVDIAKQVTDYFEKGIINNAVNLPSVDPEQLKILEPYISLSEKLGRVSSQMIEGGVSQIVIQYSGDIIGYNVKPLTLSVLKGFLEPMVERSVNFVNASFMAQERGIKVSEGTVSKRENFSNLIEVKVITEKGENFVAGTVFGKENARLVRMGDYDMDIIPEGFMLVCHNLDKAGVIGKLTTLLGESKINIAEMQVGRKTAGGTAITVISVDSDVPGDVVKKIKGIKEIKDVRMVRL